MNYILLHQSYGNVSTRKIAEKMTEPVLRLIKTNKGSWVCHDPETDKRDEVESVMSILKNPSSSIINWGNRIFGSSYDSYFDLNSPSGVGIASNKAISRKVLQNAGVPVPRTYFFQDDFPAEPLIARPPHHHAGKHFHIVTDINSFTKVIDAAGESVRDWYFSEIFNKTHEFRVHTAHGKVLVTHEKPLVPGELRANHAINHEQWRALKWSEFIPEVSIAALMATDEVGLDYAAVDVMYNADNGKVAVAEVNTSPEVTADYTSGKYAEYFSWVIRHNFPPHFPFEGTSVFYNNILRN